MTFCNHTPLYTAGTKAEAGMVVRYQQFSHLPTTTRGNEEEEMNSTDPHRQALTPVVTGVTRRLPWVAYTSPPSLMDRPSLSVATCVTRRLSWVAYTGLPFLTRAYTGPPTLTDRPFPPVMTIVLGGLHPSSLHGPSLPYGQALPLSGDRCHQDTVLGGLHQPSLPHLPSLHGPSLPHGQALPPSGDECPGWPTALPPTSALPTRALPPSQTGPPPVVTRLSWVAYTHPPSLTERVSPSGDGSHPQPHTRKRTV